MQNPMVIQQTTAASRVTVQPGVITVPVTVNSSAPTVVPSVMINPSVQSIVNPQASGAPNVQTIRPIVTQRPVGTASPRVVIGSPAVVGTRAVAPGMTLQTLQGLQGQQGHLLLKTENGQYQLLRIGPTPTAQVQTVRLSTPSYSNIVASTATGVPAQAGAVTQNAVTAQAAPTPAPAQIQKPSDNTKEKCRNFLANLLDLSSKEPKSVETNVRILIQSLIDAEVEPEVFCERLERLLNASPQPCLIGFLKKSLPLLRQALISKELVIKGINPPAPEVLESIITPPSSMKQTKPGSSIAVLQNIPVHTKLNVCKDNPTANKGVIINSKINIGRGTVKNIALSTVITPRKPVSKENKLTPSHPFDDKMGGDDDLNDVAAMGGVNLAEESQRILNASEAIGAEVRSCKDEYLVPFSSLQARLKATVAKHGLEDISTEAVGLLNHAIQDYLKTLIEKLAIISEHRIDVIKADNRYDVTQDVKGQLKFLEEVDRADRKRYEDTERELLLRAAKSRSKNEDPEHIKLKAKAKEMQRMEMEEIRQQEANMTALQAIGSRKKLRLDTPGDMVNDTMGSQGRQALRTRLKRVNFRDALFLMEQESQTRRSLLLYKSYLK